MKGIISTSFIILEVPKSTKNWDLYHCSTQFDHEHWILDTVDR